MNRIDLLFQSKKKNILSIYFTAGYPCLNDTMDIVTKIDRAGADLIEIGFPFSDPLADGPVIQQSSAKAIDNGMCLRLLFHQLTHLRTATQIPIVLMGYLNPILQYGVKDFFAKCDETGIDGLILPDMPLDYFEKNMAAFYHQYKLCNILLITPDTPVERIRYIDSIASGFIYMVSSNSITGSNKNIDIQSEYFRRIEAMQLKNPRLLGFGIHDRKTFKQACTQSQGAIIGTAFIEHISQHGTDQNVIQSFIENLKS